MNNCRTCTNTILIRREGSPINHKINCNCVLTKEEERLYFNEEREGCPHWSRSAFAGEKIREYV